MTWLWILAIVIVCFTVSVLATLWSITAKEMLALRLRVADAAEFDPDEWEDEDEDEGDGDVWADDDPDDDLPPSGPRFTFSSNGDGHR